MRMPTSFDYWSSRCTAQRRGVYPFPFVWHKQDDDSTEPIAVSEMTALFRRSHVRCALPRWTRVIHRSPLDAPLPFAYSLRSYPKPEWLGFLIRQPCLSHYRLTDGAYLGFSRPQRLGPPHMLHFGCTGTRIGSTDILEDHEYWHTEESPWESLTVAHMAAAAYFEAIRLSSV